MYLSGRTNSSAGGSQCSSSVSPSLLLLYIPPFSIKFSPVEEYDQVQEQEQGQKQD